MNLLIFCQNGVGLGHIIRSMNIANALKQIDDTIRVKFITTCRFKYIFDLNGYEVVTLPSFEDYPRLSKVAISVVQEFKPDVFISDGYFPAPLISSSLFTGIKKVAIVRKLINRRLYKIDNDEYFRHFDLIAFPHDLQEFYKYGVRKSFLSSLDKDRYVFLGQVTRSCLDKSALKKLKSKYAINEKKFNLLFTLGGGGADKNNPGSDNLFKLFIETISDLSAEEINPILVTGPFFQFDSANLPDHIVKIDYEQNFFELIHLVDLVVSPAGYNICNEIKGANVPSILVPLDRYDESQHERARLFAKEGLARVAKSPDKSEISRLISLELSKHDPNRKANLPNLASNPRPSGINHFYACIRKKEGVPKQNRARTKVGILDSLWLPITERFIFDEVASLEFYEPVIFCVLKQDNFEDRFVTIHNPRYKHLMINEFPLIKKKHRRIYYELIANYQSKIIEKDVRILHAQFMTDAFFFLELKRRTGLPLIVSVRGYDLYTKNNIDYKPLFEEADLFLVRSKSMKKDLIRIGCSPDKVEVHHSGINIHNYSRDRAPSRAKNLLMVGRLVEKKGTIFGIRLFEKLLDRHEDALLTIVGDGPLKADILNEIKDRNLMKKVKLIPKLPNSQILNLMRHSDVLLHPSKTASNGDKEGVPNSIMEAMSLGLIVVASDNGGISEIVHDGKTGFLFNEGNSKEAIHKLEFVIGNYSKLEKLRGNAFKKVKKDFDIVKQTKKLEKIYEKFN